METDFLRVFATGAGTVLKKMALLEAVPGEPTPQAIHGQGDLACGVIAFEGEVSGHLAVAFSQGAILDVYGNMLGERATTMSPEVMDTAGEMVNMICGEARKSLYDLGFHIQAGIPATSLNWAWPQGKEPPAGAPAYLPLQTPSGPVYIRLVLDGRRGEELVAAANAPQETPWEELELRCPLHDSSNVFKAAFFKAKDVTEKADLFLLPNVTVGAGEFPPVQGVAQKVVVCPRCLFASQRLDLFHSAKAKAHPFFNRLENRERISAHLNKRTLNISLKEIINNPARSPDLAFTAFNLAIISSEALVTFGGQEFAEEQDMIGQYALMSALMHKSRGDTGQENRMLNLAEKFILKRLPFQKDLDELKSLYLLGALSIYRGNEAKGGKFLAKMGEKAKRLQFVPDSQKQILPKIKELVELGGKIWNYRASIHGAPPRADYLFF